MLTLPDDKQAAQDALNRLFSLTSDVEGVTIKKNVLINPRWIVPAPAPKYTEKNGTSRTAQLSGGLVREADRPSGKNENEVAYGIDVASEYSRYIANDRALKDHRPELWMSTWASGNGNTIYRAVDDLALDIVTIFSTYTALLICLAEKLKRRYNQRLINARQNFWHGHFIGRRLMNVGGRPALDEYLLVFHAFEYPCNRFEDAQANAQALQSAKTQGGDPDPVLDGYAGFATTDPEYFLRNAIYSFARNTLYVLNFGEASYDDYGPLLKRDPENPNVIDSITTFDQSLMTYCDPAIKRADGGTPNLEPFDMNYFPNECPFVYFVGSPIRDDLWEA